jgi:hypothetical protein
VKIVYDISTGSIDRVISESQDIKIYYQHYPYDFVKNLDYIIIDDVPKRLINYKVIDGKLIKREEVEINEIKKYGKILTSQERFEEKLKPSDEEIKNAIKVVDMVELLKEVGII